MKKKLAIIGIIGILFGIFRFAPLFLPNAILDIDSLIGIFNYISILLSFVLVVCGLFLAVPALHKFAYPVVRFYVYADLSFAVVRLLGYLSVFSQPAFILVVLLQSLYSFVLLFVVVRSKDARIFLKG